MNATLDIQLTATGDRPLVGVVMGSDSDWPTMEAAVSALAEFGIACEVGVVSAHRMPEDMVTYGRSAAQRGLRVIIAGAGGAAHLPGMLAALTELPVIGVPVATVSIAGARNAGLLAARILGAGEGEDAERLRAAMRRFQSRLREVAAEKGAALVERVAESNEQPSGTLFGGVAAGGTRGVS